MSREEGQFLVEDYFTNTGGLNTAYNPFEVDKGQCVGGQNWDYVGSGIQKRFGHDLLNTVANAELRTLGLGLFDNPTLTRSVIRLAGTRIQTFDPTTATFTNLAKDITGASTSILSGGTSQPGVFSMFNSPSTNVLWCAGAGAGSAKIWGVVNPGGAGTKVTANGVVAPTGAITVGAMTGSDGVWAQGVYYYAVAYRKTSTQAQSNAALDISVTVGAGDTAKHVPLDLSTLTGVDTTLNDKIYIYRSAVSGGSAFTAGSLIATINSNVTTFSDKGPGQNSGELSAQVVPRAGNISLDNSVLPAGTYNCVTTWNNRLVTAQGSTVYISDTVKAESWPLTNIFTIPSGGNITGLSVVSISSSLGSDPVYALCIFKQKELWTLVGNTGYTSWVLTKIDNSGASGQAGIVDTGNLLAWVSMRGVYIWNGSGKPIYVSQLIEDKFQLDGDLDKTQLPYAFGMYCEQRNEVQWYLSHNTLGANKYVISLDLRLTVQNIQGPLETNPQMEGVFSVHVPNMGITAGISCYTATDAINERYFLGDAYGFMYDGYVATNDAGTPYQFEYITPYLYMGRPDCAKQYYKVIAWVLNAGSATLQLDYWTAFRFAENEGGSISVMPPGGTSNVLIWDQGLWDVNTWDGADGKITPVVFNLSSTNNSNQGDSLRLSFKNYSSTSGLVLYGFSVFYKEIAVRK